MSLNASDSKASFNCSPILVITADGSTRFILFLMQCLHGFAPFSQSQIKDLLHVR